MFSCLPYQYKITLKQYERIIVSPRCRQNAKGRRGTTSLGDGIDRKSKKIDD